VTIKWGRLISGLFQRNGGAELRARLESMPNEEYQRMLRVRPAEIADRIIGSSGSEELRAPLAERRRQQALAGGYRLPAQHPAAEEDVTLVGVGAIMRKRLPPPRSRCWTVILIRSPSWPACGVTVSVASA
jgi:pyruvate dehydrogenase complex dehydrogenase (E1) component